MIHANRKLPVSTSSIHWLDGSRRLELQCPVCATRQPHTAILDIPSLADGAKLSLFACTACGSKFFDPSGIRDFSEILGEGKHFYKSYIEVVAGIWEMYWPAACHSRQEAASLLDVGCGFGFTVDIWRRMRGAAVGIEMAAYGRAGAEQLGVPIYFDFVQNIPELQDRRFDVVYASEVIEHVPDPREFALLLSRYLSDRGVLCLTTPDAAYIRPENSGSGLLAALSPGFHGFLIGPEEMERILKSCGFAHVLVREYGERLIAWASRRPLEVDEHSPAVRAEYLQYLDEVLESRRGNDIVFDGIAYRRFREAVLTGQFDAARRALSGLEASLQNKYAVNLLDTAQSLERLGRLSSTEEYNASFPWFLPNLYFLIGVYSKLVEFDERAARRYFRASRKFTLHIAGQWGGLYVLEALSFLPEAWQQEALSAAATGDPSVCEELTEIIAISGRRLSPALGGNGFSVRQIEQGYLEGLSILASFDRTEALRKTFDSCLEYLHDSYGDWLGIDPQSDRPAPGKCLMHEQRMNLYLKIANACTRLDSHADMVAPLMQHVLVLGRMQDQPSAMAAQITEEARSHLAHRS